MFLKPVLKCIYCGSADVPLSDEHVIPFSLGGTWVLPDASCADCADITSGFERSISRGTYLALRTKAGFPTYHPKKRPKSFEAVLVKVDGNRQKINIPASKYPTIYPVLHLPPPGILSSAELNEKNPEMRLSLAGNQDEMNALAAAYPDAAGLEFSSDISWGTLCRALAKIAHSFTVGHFGTKGYTPLLPPLIFGSYPYLSNLVGGAVDIKMRGNRIFELRVDRSTDGLELSVDPTGHIIVNIDIMGGRLPTYAVVAGLVSDWNAFMTNVAHTSREGKHEYAHGMRTRFAFTHDWAIGIVNAIRGVVERDFADLMARWPLLAGFSFDAYALPPTHYLLVLKSTADPVPSGPDGAVALPHNDHPSLPPSVNDLDAWRQWCQTRLSLSRDQWPILLPVRDSGRSSIDADYEMFNEEDRRFWDAQYQHLINAQLQQIRGAARE